MSRASPNFSIARCGADFSRGGESGAGAGAGLAGGMAAILPPGSAGRCGARPPTRSHRGHLVTRRGAALPIIAPTSLTGPSAPPFMPQAAARLAQPRRHVLRGLLIGGIGAAMLGVGLLVGSVVWYGPQLPSLDPVRSEERRVGK